MQGSAAVHLFPSDAVGSVLRMAAETSAIRALPAAGTEEEVPLSGGRYTPGIVRVGMTVRRPVSSASPFVADLLGTLERRGFDGAPRHLGHDALGRDVLTYVPGRVPPRLQRWSDAQVARVGRLLRDFHDATRGSDAAGSAPVVCHHDAGPYNVVFRRGRPVALIDFDLAAPGDPLEDLGYMAWLWCMSSKPAAPAVEEQAAQVRVMLDGYGLPPGERLAVIETMLVRQGQNAQFWRERLDDPGFVMATRDHIRDRIAWSLHERAFTAAHRDVLAAALAPRPGRSTWPARCAPRQAP